MQHLHHPFLLTPFAINTYKNRPGGTPTHPIPGNSSPLSREDITMDPKLAQPVFETPNLDGEGSKLFSHFGD
jgi:hypothetical protein